MNDIEAAELPIKPNKKDGKYRAPAFYWVLWRGKRRLYLWAPAVGHQPQIAKQEIECDLWLTTARCPRYIHADQPQLIIENLSGKNLNGSCGWEPIFLAMVWITNQQTMN